MSIWNKITSFFTGSAPIPAPAPLPATKQAPTVKVPNVRAAPVPRRLTQKENARMMFECEAWFALSSYKRRQKKGWAALGFTPNEVAEIKLHIGD